MAGVELATAYVSLTISANQIAPQVNKQFGAVEKEADKTGKKAGARLKSGIGNSLKGAGAMFAGAFAGAAAVAGFKDIIGKASELEQSIGGVKAVFKGSSGEIETASKAAAKNLGLSRDEYNKLATTLGAGLKNKGIADFAGETQSLITIGGDLAAQFGGSTQEAVEALSSAMRGESDPIEKYGVALNDTAVNAKLAEMGVKKSGGAYTEQQKTMARLALITEQTKDAQGAFGREGETAAGRQAKMTAALDNIKTTIGTGLLPAFSGVVNIVSDFVTGMDQGTGSGGRFKEIIIQVKDGVMGVVDWFKRYSDILIPVGGAIVAIVAAMKVWSAITKAYIAIQTALNVVMSANPVGLVILAIVGLVAALVLAYKKSETFRAIVDAAWKGVKAAISGVVDWFRNTAWPWMRDAFTWIGDKAKWLWQVIIKPYFTAMSTLWKTVFGFLRDTAWPIARDAFANIAAKGKWMWENVLKPAFDATKTGANAVKDAFVKAKDGIGAAWDKLKELAAKPLRFVIETVMNGLIGGFNTLSGWIGGPQLGKLKANFATGGVLPGYTPGRDVHRFVSPTGGVLDLSGGEPIMRPEFGRVVGTGWVNSMNAAARSGGVSGVRRALAAGGGHHAYAGGGVIDWLKSKSSSALDWARNKAGAIWDAMQDPVGFLKERIPAIPGGTKLAELGVAAKDKLLGFAVSKIKSLFSAFQSAFSREESLKGGSRAGVGGFTGGNALARVTGALLPGLTITNSYRSPAHNARVGGRAGSLHMDRANPAVDIGGSTSQLNAMYRKLVAMGGWRELLWQVAGHYDHVHVAKDGGVLPKPLLFDRGGMLPTGTSLVHNGTGAPEPLARMDGGVRLHPDDVNLLAAAIRSGASDGISGLAGRAMTHAPVGRY